MQNVIIAVILLAIAGGIIGYLVRAKKRGDHCVGCPYAKDCHKKCGRERSAHSGIKRLKQRLFVI